MKILCNSLEPDSAADEEDAAEHLLLQLVGGASLDALPDGDVEGKEETAVVGRRRIVRV